MGRVTIAEADLAPMISIATAAWPAIAMPRQRFVEHVQTQLRAGHELASLRADDLYLACACAAGDPAAVAAFHHAFRPDVERLVRRWRLPHGLGDDVVQALWERLLVGAPPRIAGYNGRGQLRSWVRMAASRLLVDLARQRVPEADPMADLASLLEPGSDLQLAVIKANLAAPVRTAIEQAVAALEPRERSLLRYRFIHGLGVDEIAELYGLHRVSASRALTRAREALHGGLRAAIAARTGLEGSDADSVVRLCWSRLELSLDRIL